MSCTELTADNAVTASMTTNLATRLLQFAVRANLAAVLLLLSPAFAAADPTDSDHTLKSSTEFASIANKTERSNAIFQEIGKLVTHPRCMNCHPAGDHPQEGGLGQHQPQQR